MVDKIGGQLLSHHLLWSGVGGQLLSYHLLWSGVGGQLLSYHVGGLYCTSSLEGPFRGAFGKKTPDKPTDKAKTAENVARRLHVWAKTNAQIRRSNTHRNS